MSDKALVTRWARPSQTLEKQKWAAETRKMDGVSSSRSELNKFMKIIITRGQSRCKSKFPPIINLARILSKSRPTKQSRMSRMTILRQKVRLKMIPPRKMGVWLPWQQGLKHAILAKDPTMGEFQTRPKTSSNQTGGTCPWIRAIKNSNSCQKRNLVSLISLQIGWGWDSDNQLQILWWEITNLVTLWPHKQEGKERLIWLGREDFTRDSAVRHIWTEIWLQRQVPRLTKIITIASTTPFLKKITLQIRYLKIRISTAFANKCCKTERACPKQR